MPNRNKPELIVSEIVDNYIRRNFLNLKNYFQEQSQLLDFKFFEVKFTANSLTQLVSHDMGIVPVDVVFLSITKNASVSFNIGMFTKEKMSVTVDKACAVRFLAGRSSATDTGYQPDKTDKIVYGPNAEDL